MRGAELEPEPGLSVVATPLENGGKILPSA
jgi:hypothetical protein